MRCVVQILFCRAEFLSPLFIFHPPALSVDVFNRDQVIQFKIGDILSFFVFPSGWLLLSCVCIVKLMRIHTAVLYRIKLLFRLGDGVAIVFLAIKFLRRFGKNILFCIVLRRNISSIFVIEHRWRKPEGANDLL